MDDSKKERSNVERHCPYHTKAGKVAARRPKGDHIAVTINTLVSCEQQRHSFHQPCGAVPTQHIAPDWV